MRLDELMVQRGLAQDLHDAQAAIMAGEVVLEEHRAESAGLQVKPDANIRLKSKKKKMPFVSRGGLKLDKAIACFNIDVSGAGCVDIGASTGGFTDCLLKHGASHVSAVDVGFGQFDWGLRNDPRVSLFERTNIRETTSHEIEGPFDVAVADLSFVGLATVLPDIAALLKPGAVLVSLIKPQFEADHDQVEDGGIITDPNVHAACVQNVLDQAVLCGLEPQEIAFSPIKGPAGNIEFLFWAKKTGQDEVSKGSIDSKHIEEIVAAAHDELKGEA